MNSTETKACIFGGLLVTVYAIHQATVGGDGAVLAGVAAAIAAIGGYTVAAAKMKRVP